MLAEKVLSSEPLLVKHGFNPEIEYLSLLLHSRAADNRESILFRQGRGAFCLPSAGHENMAAVSYALHREDFIYCHYRDRALLLARGTSMSDLALGFFAKKGSSSEGRQLASHFSDVQHNVVSCASPIASQCLPATGTAWSMKLKNTGNIVVCCIGEAGMRQGEFYEAWCFAVQESLPIIFVIEDNGYGISTPTDKMNPLIMGVFASERIHKINGRVSEQVFDGMQFVAEIARTGNGPSILWVSFDRLMSHTSSDDQRVYRTESELKSCADRDPIILLRNQLFAQGVLDAEEWEALQAHAHTQVEHIYADAEKASEPDVSAVLLDVRSVGVTGYQSAAFLSDMPELTMAKAVNMTLQNLLANHEKVVLFGQDIADPKGGVFGLTKGLSTQYPHRVFNAPLAEATICGVAAGMALHGHVPIFELQFIDFMATGFNQIANQIATMRWRTAGQYKCPLVFLAPCGGYTHGGGPWHSQTNESLFAHIPGLNVHMPSTAVDAANFILNCAASEDPSLILLPKMLFFKSFPTTAVTSLHFNSANVLSEGEDVTILAWGNCIDLVLQAADELQKDGISSEIIDLRSIVPCDMLTISRSLEKTGRLVVVHEDNKTCGVGQSIIAQVVANQQTWDCLYASPKLVCRDDVLVPFNAHLAAQILPSVAQVIDAARSTLIS